MHDPCLYIEFKRLEMQKKKKKVKVIHRHSHLISNLLLSCVLFL